MSKVQLITLGIGLGQCIVLALFLYGLYCFVRRIVGK